MDIKTLWKKLDIGAVGLGWSYFRNGWAGIAKYLCEKFSKLLKKLPAEQLKYYADIAKKLAQLLRMVIDTFIKSENVKKAAEATLAEVEVFAGHLEDGDYSTAELDQDIDTIKALIKLWKEAAK